jgi:surface antigen
MAMVSKTLIALGAASMLALAGCASGPTQEQTGAVVGGALGGLLGAQVGGGRGTTAAIIAGTLAGAVIGGSVGRTMDTVDRGQLAGALEQVPDNRSVAWQNPNTGAQYEVTPQRTFRSGGRDCREYTMLAYLNGRPEEVTGVACRDAQGRWVNQ